jgi:RNA polymerase sigma-70 factor (ECF subfamily)
MMRRVLVEHARKRHALKRGGLAQRVSLEEAEESVGGRTVDLIELDDALCALAQLSGRGAQVVELRFFGGLTVAETSNILGVSEETVLRDWKFARAWLFGRLKRSADAT